MFHCNYFPDKSLGVLNFCCLIIIVCDQHHMDDKFSFLARKQIKLRQPYTHFYLLKNKSHTLKILWMGNQGSSLVSFKAFLFTLRYAQ